MSSFRFLIDTPPVSKFLSISRFFYYIVSDSGLSVHFICKKVSYDPLKPYNFLPLCAILYIRKRKKGGSLHAKENVISL